MKVNRQIVLIHKYKLTWKKIDQTILRFIARQVGADDSFWTDLRGRKSLNKQEHEVYSNVQQVMPE